MPAALRRLGFREPEVRHAVHELRRMDVEPRIEALLTAAVQLLTPAVERGAAGSA